MTSAALDPLETAVLRALYELAELDCPAHAGVLARALEQVGLSVRAVDIARVLLVLDARGLVAADQARLSMRGLVEAARCGPLGLERAPWFPQLKRQAVKYRQTERLRKVYPPTRATGAHGRR